MNKVQVRLTIYFNGTFWVGVFERTIDNNLQVASYLFKTEPKEIEIYNLILYNYNSIKFSKKTISEDNIEKCLSPKRMKRLVKKQVVKSIGTKSQQLLKEQYQENKIKRKVTNKLKKEEKEKIKFELKQSKRIEKHKGR